MTEPGPETPAGPEAPAEPADPGQTAGSSLPPETVSARAWAPALGLFRFTIEGRRAPGLFVAGWLSTVVGAILAFVGLLAGPSFAGAVLFVVGLAVLFGGLLLLGGSQVVERGAAGLAYAGPSPILVFGATIVGLYLAVVVVGTPLQILDIEVEGPALALLGVAIQAVVAIGILRLLVVGPGGLSWSEMGLRASAPAALRELAYGAVFALPVIVVTAIAVYALVTLIGSAPESPLPPAGTSVGLAINLLAGAVIAPFYEELLFRGFALTAWARVVTPAAAIVRTSVLFALAHNVGQGGDSFGQAFGLVLVATAGRLPVALVLGWVFVRRRSLWASVGLHAAFNAILLVIAESALENLPAG
ncbi:MAG TPA: type II CAAX endopeptidase family protein [Candidatus Limnocylindrales bacterium]|nr:type II CAAX endopeptidase family protein [Candidatus Limnocylindrales bacterium]